MAEVLSQSEIDALLSALSTGELAPEEVPKEEEKQKVKVYNFRTPQKFSKEHIRALEFIHDKFSRIISNFLTGQLRKNIKVKVENIEQITYEEFIKSIPNPTILTNFRMAPLSSMIFLETNPDFSYKVIDILLGGDGQRVYTNKEFSDIDKNIIGEINKGLISNLKLAWDDFLEVEPEVESIETNPALSQTLGPNEPVALITFSSEIEDSNSFINLCIPYLSIEKSLDKLVFRRKSENENNIDSSVRDKIEHSLNEVELELTTELGVASLSVDEFLRLSRGDVIKLTNRYDSPVKVFIENEECYYAKPGTIGKNAGVALLDIIDKDVENYE